MAPADRTGGSSQPRTPVEHALDAAMTAAKESLAERGGRLLRIYIAVEAENVGPMTGCTAASGPELPEDLSERGRAVFAFLLSEAMSVGRQLGIGLDLLGMPGRPGGQG